MEVLILIVCYNGAGTVLDAVKSALAAAGDICVLAVDNGSTDHTLRLLKSIRDSRFRVMPMGYNSGLGAAFNAGMNAACDRGASWLYIMDQDSVLAAGCLETLFHTALDLLKHTPSVAAVSPTVRCRAYPEIIHYPLKWDGKQLIAVGDGIFGHGSGPVSVDSPISSGTLYRVEALAAIDGFRESYFIDFIDHECHLRLVKAGYSLWWEPAAVVYHRLGSIQRMTASGFWIEHPAYRYYYMTRNMTEGYYRLGGLTAMLCFWKEAARHMKRLYVNGRYPYASICYMLRGCCDALFGKSGPLASNH